MCVVPGPAANRARRGAAMEAEQRSAVVPMVRITVNPATGAVDVQTLRVTATRDAAGGIIFPVPVPGAAAADDAAPAAPVVGADPAPVDDPDDDDPIWDDDPDDEGNGAGNGDGGVAVVGGAGAFVDRGVAVPIPPASHIVVVVVHPGGGALGASNLILRWLRALWSFLSRVAAGILLWWKRPSGTCEDRRRPGIRRFLCTHVGSVALLLVQRRGRRRPGTLSRGQSPPLQAA